MSHTLLAGLLEKRALLPSEIELPPETVLYWNNVPSLFAVHKPAFGDRDLRLKPTTTLLCTCAFSWPWTTIPSPAIS